MNIKYSLKSLFLFKLCIIFFSLNSFGFNAEHLDHAKQYSDILSSLIAHNGGKPYLYESIKSDYRSLNDKDLAHADLSDLNLSGAFLHRTKLNNTILKKAKLERVLLEGANLKYTDLTDANLKNTHFCFVSFYGANLTRTDFQNTYFYGANLTAAYYIDETGKHIVTPEYMISIGAELSPTVKFSANPDIVHNPDQIKIEQSNTYSEYMNSFLQQNWISVGVLSYYPVNERTTTRDSLIQFISAPEIARLGDFTTSNLDEHDFSHHRLVGTDFFMASLNNAYLYRTDLFEANFAYAKMKNAFLFGSNLSEADLLSADLSGANLSCSLLCKTNFRSAKLNRANLNKCWAVHADFTDADLTGAIMSRANLCLAFYDDASGRHLISPEYLCSKGATFNEDTIFSPEVLEKKPEAKAEASAAVEPNQPQAPAKPKKKNKKKKGRK